MRATIYKLPLFVLITLFTISSGCTPSVTPKPSLTPAISSESPAKQTTPSSSDIDWDANGVIQAGEYTNKQTYGDYELNWFNSGQNIYIGLKVKTNGWISVAIQPGSRMKNADIILCFVNDGKTTVSDQFSNGDFGPHFLDTELNGTDDILEFAGKEEDGYTIIEFKRKLDTGDKYDHPIIKGKNQILWSYGSNDNPTSRHVNRGYGDIIL